MPMTAGVSHNGWLIACLGILCNSLGMVQELILASGYNLSLKVDVGQMSLASN